MESYRWKCAFENALRENKFVKALSASNTLIDGRVQVKMPWKESGLPKQSNYDLFLRRMYSAEKSFKKKDRFEIVDQELQKLVDQGFVIKVARENVDHGQREWYFPSKQCSLQKKAQKSGSCLIRLVKDTMVSPSMII